MPEAIQTPSGTAYAAKVVAGSRQATPSSPSPSRPPGAGNSASNTPSRIPVPDTHNTGSTNNTGNNNRPTNANSGSATAPAGAAAPSGASGTTSQHPNPTAATAPKLGMADLNVQRASAYLKEVRCMSHSQPEVTLEAVGRAALILEKMTDKEITKGKLQKAIGAVGELIMMFDLQHRQTLLNLMARHEQEVMATVKESMGRVEDRIEDLQDQLAGTAPVHNSAGEHPPQGFSKTPFATTADVPPPRTPRDRKARNAEYVREKQVLFKPCLSEAPEGVDILPPICADSAIADRFTKAIKEGDLETKAGCALLPLTVRRLNIDVLVNFPSPDAAKWIRTAEGSDALEHHLRYHITAVGRKYKVVAHIVPTTFVANDPTAMREIEQVNNLPPKCIENAQYIKPIALRSPGQRHANVMLTLTTPYAANSTILDGVLICGLRSQCWRQKYEPPRCARCQGHGHIVKTCHQTEDTCGICGDKHRDKACPRTGKLWCVSCKTDKHSSRDRSCPTFIRRCAIYDSRHPENTRVFFPTEEAWTLDAMVEPGTPFSSYHRQQIAPAKPRLPSASLGQAPVVPARKAGSQRARRAAAIARDLQAALDEAAKEAATETTNPESPH